MRDNLKSQHENYEGSHAIYGKSTSSSSRNEITPFSPPFWVLPRLICRYSDMQVLTAGGLGFVSGDLLPCTSHLVA